MLATKLATFGGGCFWCTEACFLRVKGVSKVVSGYAGGKDPSPSYKKICDGLSDHAEVIQVTYDPNVVSYLNLLKAFFASHDPTTLNRQGNDVGTQYRSIILYHDEEQHQAAKHFLDQMNKTVYSGKVVTELTKLEKFFPAEDYHQNYYALNPGQGYCMGVVSKKVKNFLATYNPDA